LSELPPAPDTAAGLRAAVRQAQESMAVQEAQVDIARSQRLPTASIFTSWSRVAYPSSLVPAFGDFLPNWTITALVSLPLFTGGRIRGDVLVAQAGLEEARALLSLTRKLAAVDGRQALDLLAAAEAAWEASSGTVEQAERAYRISEVRFVEGLATQLEVMDSRIQLEQASANRALAARDLQVARLRVVLLPLLPLAVEQAEVAIQSTVTPVVASPAASSGMLGQPRTVVPARTGTTGTGSGPGGG
jgi:outer membrane protein TolC